MLAAAAATSHRGLIHAARASPLRQGLVVLGHWTVIGGALNYGFAQIRADAAPPSSVPGTWFLTSERLRLGQTGAWCSRSGGAARREDLAPRDRDGVGVHDQRRRVGVRVDGARSTFNLFQFHLGGLCLSAILLTGWLGSWYRLIRIAMLFVCCLPVIAGITGTFGAAASQSITLGVSNVAGYTEKSFTSATIFVAYCIGNIVGPQLIRSQTKVYHYPELWLGLIIWLVL
ncbi:hypothetical protein F4775DRAFT_591224 [Biscogniauxia sp. FL1348]|nr:hypothetical protein F4775DRAFT_591224 [Biscogniauxia sp. FL1348]